MAIDGTGGVPQVQCTQMELTAEGNSIQHKPFISAASELQSFLSQSPRVLLSPTENDRFCSLLKAQINAASYEWEKHPMRQLLDEVHRLKEATASCSFSSRPETVSLQAGAEQERKIEGGKIKRNCLKMLKFLLFYIREGLGKFSLQGPGPLPPPRLRHCLQGHENLALEISQSAISRSNLEAEITSLKDQAAQLEERLKAINEQRTQKELELSTVKESEAGMQIRALQSCQATAEKLKIAHLRDLFDFVKSVLPKP
uniref:Uncharacterized protein n=1 Tax=Populus davidiana TaxID=266767 RepID=A0A6M2E8J7_9ROSI